MEEAITASGRKTRTIFPARNHNDAKRALVLASDLPLIVKRLHKLEKKIENLPQ